MKTTLRYLKDQVWFCPELNKTGTISHESDGNISFDFVDENGNPRRRIWNSWNVVLLEPTAPLTEQEVHIKLGQIRERRSKITKPPWILMPEVCGPEGQGVYQRETIGLICEVGDPYPRGNNHPQENMEFIVNTPDDIDFLLQVYDELKQKTSLE